MLGFIIGLFIVGLIIAVPITLLLVGVIFSKQSKLRKQADKVIDGTLPIDIVDINNIIDVLQIGNATEADKIRIDKLRKIRDNDS